MQINMLRINYQGGNRYSSVPHLPSAFIQVAAQPGQLVLKTSHETSLGSVSYSEYSLSFAHQLYWICGLRSFLPQTRCISLEPLRPLLRTVIFDGGTPYS